MQLQIDPRSPVTPSEQLADQVRFAVAAKRLVPGDRLPSVRDVARSARINPNTVSRAWRELELTGLIEARRGSGMFVTPEGPSVAAAFRARAVAERVGRATGEALDAGLSPAEVLEMVQDACAVWAAALTENTERAEEPQNGATPAPEVER